MLSRNLLTQHHKDIAELLVSTPNKDDALRTAVGLLSEGRDSSAGNIGDLLQAMAAASNYMSHKVFGDNQRSREVVR